MSVLYQTAAVNTSASATQLAITASVEADTCSDLIICYVKVRSCSTAQILSKFLVPEFYLVDSSTRGVCVVLHLLAY